MVGEAWPKLFQPDYTEVITKILQAKPQALYSCLWGGDLTSFIDQANIYALFSQTEVFAINMADYTALTVVKNLPKGIHSGNRYIKTFPRTPENAAWGDAYKREVQRLSDQLVVGERDRDACCSTARSKKANSADGKKLAEALRGLKIKSPFGADGTVTMRAEDQTTDRLRDRLGHHDPEGALRAGGAGRRLEADPRARSRVEEEEGLHLIGSKRRGAELRRQRDVARGASARPIGVALDLDALAGCLAVAACLVTQTTSGLIIGMLLFLVAAGLTLIFGVLKVVNFTHGSFYMLGAYFAYDRLSASPAATRWRCWRRALGVGAVRPAVRARCS